MALTVTGPSECGIKAVEYIRKHRIAGEVLDVLDIGCGNGRDLFHLLKIFQIDALGMDIDGEAIAHASRAIPREHQGHVRFRCCTISELDERRYDVIIASEVYHFLRKNKREEMREFIKRSLKPMGLLFLSSLSANDKEYFGKGIPVQGDLNSFEEKVFSHFSTREELMQEFAFLDIKELKEREFHYKIRRVKRTGLHGCRGCWSGKTSALGMPFSRPLQG